MGRYSVMLFSSGKGLIVEARNEAEAVRLMVEDLAGVNVFLPHGDTLHLVEVRPAHEARMFMATVGPQRERENAVGLKALKVVRDEATTEARPVPVKVGERGKDRGDPMEYEAEIPNLIRSRFMAWTAREAATLLVRLNERMIRKALPDPVDLVYVTVRNAKTASASETVGVQLSPEGGEAEFPESEGAPKDFYTCKRPVVRVDVEAGKAAAARALRKAADGLEADLGEEEEVVDEADLAAWRSEKKQAAAALRARAERALREAEETERALGEDKTPEPTATGSAAPPVTAEPTRVGMMDLARFFGGEARDISAGNVGWIGISGKDTPQASGA